MKNEASIEIVEEPASNLTRFRYFSEGRSSSILGTDTTAERKTFPAIKIVNYTGKVSVVVSCVTKDAPYKSHPHELVGKNCARGVCYIADLTTNSEAPSIIYFPRLSIQSAKRNEIEAKLKERQILRIDPFGNGFRHIRHLRRTLNSVRLCFQVIIRPDPLNPTYKIQLKPKVTQPIYNIKITTELMINDISDTSSPICGEKTIMIFCSKINKGDIKVRFFRKRGENIIWEDWGTRLNVHRNFAISFMTPSYQQQDEEQSINIIVNVFIQLIRPSDNVQSTSISFRYIRDVTIMDVMVKRKKCKIVESEELFQLLSNIYDLNIPSTYVQQRFYSEYNNLDQLRDSQKKQHAEQQEQNHPQKQGYSWQLHYKPFESDRFYESNVPEEHFPQQQLHPQN